MRRRLSVTNAEEIQQFLPIAIRCKKIDNGIMNVSLVKCA